METSGWGQEALAPLWWGMWAPVYFHPQCSLLPHTYLLSSITLPCDPCAQSSLWLWGKGEVNKTPHWVHFAPLPQTIWTPQSSGRCVCPNWEPQPCSLTCPYACHADQPPLWEPREHQHHPVPRLKATHALEHISCLPGLLPQLLKVPLNLCSLAIDPPEGRDPGPVPSLDSSVDRKETEKICWGFLLVVF